jgi:pimeloyl-ACP methyl ester carboxylesterase
VNAFRGTATARAVAALVAVTALALAPLPVAAQIHARVTVGDHALDAVTAGHGGPAIVFETGLADSLDVWLPMWHTMAQFTTVMAYSRAGFGRSESGRSDHSVAGAVTDLHELLRHIGVSGPYILVARSYGSLIARLYVSQHPDDVVGIVLVDGTHEQQVQRFGTLDASYPRKFQAYYDSVLARTPAGPSAAETRETVRIQAAGQLSGLKPLPDIPMAVLTSMQSSESAPYVNGTARGHEVWRDLHDEWFRRSHNAIHIATDRSGHAIQDDEPALVEMAIHFVLDRARARP